MTYSLVQINANKAFLGWQPMLGLQLVLKSYPKCGFEYLKDQVSWTGAVNCILYSYQITKKYATNNTFLSVN